jgi:HicA toxin of bacterial toxin-antitoxin,
VYIFSVRALASCRRRPLNSNVRHQKTARVAISTALRYHTHMKRAHQRNLEAVFSHPTSANIAWKDIEAMLLGLGAEFSEREGSRVAIVLFNEVRVFHRPHPSPKTDKGAVVSVRKWLEQHGVKP